MTPECAFALFALGGLIASCSSGVLLYRARKTWPWGEALAIGSLPVSLYVTVVLLLVVISQTNAWDAARLTPTVMLARGHQVYSSLHDGAVQTTMYPPMWPVSYLPAAIGDTPAQVLFFGSALTLLFSFGPVAALLVVGLKNVRVALLGVAAFVLTARYFGSLSNALFTPRADPPSLGFALLACSMVIPLKSLSRGRIVAASMLVWMSVLSKQVMIPLLVAIPLWFLVTSGVKETIRLVAWLGLSGALLVATIGIWFQLDAVWLNTVTIPMNVPWVADKYPRVVAILRVTAEFWQHSTPLLILTVVGVSISAARCTTPATSWPAVREFLRLNPSCLPLLVAVLMVPMAILGRVKIGGALNTFSPSTYFLLAGGMLAVFGIPDRLTDRSREVSLAAVACCCLLLAGAGAGEIVKTLATRGTVVRHRAQVAFEYLVEEDPAAFFPTHPMAHLLADGSLYHLSQALHDREKLAGLPLSDRQRGAYLPSQPSVVCFDPAWGTAYFREHYFIEYRQERRVDSLGPEWSCYSR